MYLYRSAVGAFSAITFLAAVTGDNFHIAAITAGAALLFLPLALREAQA